MRSKSTPYFVYIVRYCKNRNYNRTKNGYETYLTDQQYIL